MTINSHLQFTIIILTPNQHPPIPTDNMVTCGFTSAGEVSRARGSDTEDGLHMTQVS